MNCDSCGESESVQNKVWGVNLKNGKYAFYHKECGQKHLEFMTAMSLKHFKSMIKHLTYISNIVVNSK